MDDFWKNLSTPSWWIGVVIVGVAINLLSAYLKPRMDSSLSQVSSRRKARSQRLQNLRSLRISHLQQNNHEQVLSAVRQLRLSLRSLTFFAQAFALAGLAAGAWFVTESERLGGLTGRVLFGVTMTIVLIALLLAIDDHRLAWGEASELDEARKHAAHIDGQSMPNRPLQPTSAETGPAKSEML